MRQVWRLSSSGTSESWNGRLVLTVRSICRTWTSPYLTSFCWKYKIMGYGIFFHPSCDKLIVDNLNDYKKKKERTRSSIVYVVEIRHRVNQYLWSKTRELCRRETSIFVISSRLNLLQKDSSNILFKHFTRTASLDITCLLSRLCLSFSISLLSIYLSVFLASIIFLLILYLDCVYVVFLSRSLSSSSLFFYGVFSLSFCLFVEVFL